MGKEEGNTGPKVGPVRPSRYRSSSDGGVKGLGDRKRIGVV